MPLIGDFISGRTGVLPLSLNICCRHVDEGRDFLEVLGPSPVSILFYRGQAALDAEDEPIMLYDELLVPTSLRNDATFCELMYRYVSCLSSAADEETASLCIEAGILDLQRWHHGMHSTEVEVAHTNYQPICSDIRFAVPKQYMDQYGEAIGKAFQRGLLELRGARSPFKIDKASESYFLDAQKTSQKHESEPISSFERRKSRQRFDILSDILILWQNNRTKCDQIQLFRYTQCDIVRAIAEVNRRDQLATRRRKCASREHANSPLNKQYVSPFATRIRHKNLSTKQRPKKKIHGVSAAGDFDENGCLQTGPYSNCEYVLIEHPNDRQEQKISYQKLNVEKQEYTDGDGKIAAANSLSSGSADIMDHSQMQGTIETVGACGMKTTLRVGDGDLLPAPVTTGGSISNQSEPRLMSKAADELNDVFEDCLEDEQGSHSDTMYDRQGDDGNCIEKELDEQTQHNHIAAILPTEDKSSSIGAEATLRTFTVRLRWQLFRIFLWGVLYVTAWRIIEHAAGSVFSPVYQQLLSYKNLEIQRQRLPYKVIERQ